VCTHEHTHTRVCVCACVCVCVIDVGIYSMPDLLKTRGCWLVGDVDSEVP